MSRQTNYLSECCWVSSTQIFIIFYIDNFGFDVNAYDLIIGYRADDSYFDFAETFLNNGITVQQLAKAMRLGKLGEQIVIKSEFAFSKLTYEGYEIAQKDKYYVQRKARDDEVNKMYLNIIEEETDGLYIQDSFGDVTESNMDAVTDAAEGCPVGAIEIE